MAEVVHLLDGADRVLCIVNCTLHVNIHGCHVLLQVHKGRDAPTNVFLQTVPVAKAGVGAWERGSVSTTDLARHTLLNGQVQWRKESAAGPTGDVSGTATGI